MLAVGEEEDAMSLRYALLGLLAEGPASGYELTQRFGEGIGSFAWTAGHSQIYPELARLVADGLVEVVAEGPRGRRDHALTDPGREALRTWLMGPRTGSRTVRSEFVLRLFLLSTLDAADASEVLDRPHRSRPPSVRSAKRASPPATARTWPPSSVSGRTARRRSGRAGPGSSWLSVGKVSR
jgi:DNA-binding PadR family transcriptional regulator